ncbi:hypothetical protein [Campylobacter geochelonis]|uniref:hypothetical protein n=1 Tax=Campylobacter geochelonis TaxID=1780362 RepID=UPI0007707481|nr:hypothetical protein [Campylobacter geochelonis]CZE50019.1 Uncharacterised protein [Campylobacter geochelonis]
MRTILFICFLVAFVFGLNLENDKNATKFNAKDSATLNKILKYSDNNKTLDELLEFVRKNPEKINYELECSYDDRIFSHFILSYKENFDPKYDFDIKRLEKILAFKPDLNYKIDSMTPVDYLLYYLGFLDEEEVIKALKLLIENGVNLNNNFSLVHNYLNYPIDLNKFKTFVFLLDNGANTDGVLREVGGEILLFASSDNGFRMSAKEKKSDELRKFLQSDKFTKFSQEKAKFVKEILKRKKLSQINHDELELFIKVNAYIDNEMMIKILLENGLCDIYKMCEFTVSEAQKHQSDDVLRLFR